MKNNTILIILLFFSVTSYPQLYDNIWVRGTGGLSPQPPEWRTSFMDFKTNPPTITLGNSSVPLTGAVGAMSDSLGKLLFFTNLIKVYNAKEEVMINGDKINEGVVWEQFKAYGYPSLPATKIIPIFNDSLFLMIYVQLHTNQPYLIGSPARYAIIDPYFQNGKGKVIKKDIPYHHINTLSYDFVRHGNGKDWWLILCEWNVNEEEQRYYRFLVDQKGVFDTIGTQKFNLSSRIDGLSRISQNGSKYVKYSVGEGINSFSVFDIDRCTGLLNFRKNYEFDKVYNIFGFELSPNGRYVYPSRPGAVYQIDLESSDEYLFIDTLSYIDGYKNNSLPSCFGFTQLTPFNEIMVLPEVCNPKTINIIHNPDLPGAAADFEQHAIIGLNFAARGPIYPNYRLGALEGSPCDTLGFNTISNTWIFQNNAVEACVSDNQATSFNKLIFRIYNQNGDNLLEEQFFSPLNQYCLSTTSLIPGEYDYYIWVDDKKLLKGKFDKL